MEQLNQKIMTNFYDISCSLADILTDSVYLWSTPEVIDFTIHAGGKIIIEGKGCVEIEIDRDNVANIASLLENTVFNKEVVKTLYCYNIKPLFTYFKFYLNKNFTPSASVVDLKVIENFLNITRKRPENLIEAVNRSKAFSKYKAWKSVYVNVHLPLIYKVLPTIETTCLLDEVDKVGKYPYYEIEGQINGRLNCLKKYNKSYLPHNLSPEQSKTLKPSGYGNLFLLADYKNYEVSVLQWLSKDEVLKEILLSGEDLYSVVYRIITQDECDTPKKRDISKKMFLPVMYGLGGKGLSKAIDVDEDMGSELVDRIRRKFSVATNWMKKQQDFAQDRKYSVDFFGRPRRYEDNKYYLARNFAVQGVAATVCAEKSIKLYNAIKDTNAKICFTVHDSYALICPYEEAKKLYTIVKESLESESKMCPGLQMKVEVKYGKRLNNMKQIKGVE